MCANHLLLLLYLPSVHNIFFYIYFPISRHKKIAKSNYESRKLDLCQCPMEKICHYCDNFY